MSAQDELTAERSHINPAYFLIRLNGRVWRVCHEANLSQRWPEIKLIVGES